MGRKSVGIELSRAEGLVWEWRHWITMDEISSKCGEGRADDWTIDGRYSI